MSCDLRLAQRSKRFAVVGTVAMSMLACHEPATERATDEAKTPIVFVHGSGLSSASWRAMQEYFRERQYPRSYLRAFDIRPVNAANEHAAEHSIASGVTSALDRAARRSRAADPRRVDIVAHSMGAFSSRYYAVREPQKMRVWIGIAGANHGTDALCGSSGAGDAQMCPAFAQRAAESWIQAELNGTPDEPRDASPYGLGEDSRVSSIRPEPGRCIAYFTVRIEPDEWIKPERSALLEGAGGFPVPLDDLPAVETSPGNFLFTAAAAHDDLPAHPQLIQLVHRILTAADEHWVPRCAQAHANSSAERE